MSDIGIIDALNNHIRFNSAGHIESLDRDAAIKAVAQLGHRPIAQEIERCISIGSFQDNELVAKSDLSQDSGMVTALMLTPYVKDSANKPIVSLHAFSFSDLDSLAPLREAFPAPNVRPVALHASTAALRNSVRFVAFFPDSIIGKLPEGYADGIYFCAKFVEGYQTRVLPLLNRLWSPESFSSLRAATPHQLHQAAAIWVHLHEFHHCHTLLSIDTYHKVKSTRLSGAFEELRVDLSAMLSQTEPYLGAELSQLVFEFILAYRLVYYGSSFDPARDYDAVTSVALHNMLSDANALRTARDGDYMFSAPTHLTDALQGALDHFTAAEQQGAKRLQLSRSEADQIEQRKSFEAMMRSLCRTDPQAVIQRGAFHQRHAAALSPELAEVD